MAKRKTLGGARHATVVDAREADRSRRTVLSGLLSLGVSACGGAPEPGRDLLSLGQANALSSSAPPAPAPPAAGRDAVELTKAFGDARMGIVAHVARVAAHPLGAALRSRLPFAASFERAGIDPTKDVDRLLLVDHKPHERHGMTVWEHHIPDDRFVRFMLAAVEESQPRGVILEHRPRTTAPRAGGGTTDTHTSAQMIVRLNHRGFSGTSVTVSETLVLTSWKDESPLVRALERSGGIPMPIGDELASFFLLEPGETLGGDVPRTFGDLRGDLRPTKTGGLAIVCSAPSSAPTEDAAYVRRAVPMLLEDALGKSGRMLLDGFVVKSSATEVSAEVTLDEDATLTLVAMLNLAVPLRLGF